MHYRAKIIAELKLILSLVSRLSNSNFPVSIFQFLLSQVPGLTERHVPLLRGERLESRIRIEGNFAK
jgi:hypothetical protein